MSYNVRISNKMQKTTQRKSQKPLNSFQRYWQFIVSENFGHARSNQLKQHDDTVTSMDVYLHATNTQNNSTLPRDIGTLLFWRIRTCPDMPDQNQ